MGSPRQPLGRSPNGSISSSSCTETGATRDAALTGANLAFLKSLPPQEALKFLRKRASPPPPPKSPKPQLPGHARKPPSSPAGRRDVSAATHAVPGRLTVPKRPRNTPNTSASSITATLAAARAAPSVRARSPSVVSDNASIRSVSRASVRSASQVSVQSASHVSVRAAESAYPTPSLPKRVSPDKLDHTPIAPTTSLVDMFERRGTPPPIKSPKPVRKPPILRTQPLEPISTRLAQQPKPDDSSSDESFSSARDHLSPVQHSRPELPPTRRSAKRTDSKLQVPTEPSIRVQPPSRTISADKPSSPLPSGPSSRSSSRTKPMPISRDYSPNHLTHPNNPSIHAVYNQLHPRRMTPLTSDETLANAIVASSLASSRAPSPTKLPPPPMPGRRTSHGSFFSRTPSPAKKGMRHTMRKASESETSDDEDPYGKHKKKRRVHKHPNKHHEGDRKRWRDAVTQRERKRYEGVWATNKGNCVEYTRAELDVLASRPDSKESNHIRATVADQVADLVVRDIWVRSRLPQHELEQVWDLVDNQRCGRLMRDEFVVGLWLIDQRLKGRKLPVKVSDSVWNSVRLLSGIKLRAAKG